MDPAGASMRAGLKGLKIAEKRRLLPADQPGAAKNCKKWMDGLVEVGAVPRHPRRVLDASESRLRAVPRQVIARARAKRAMLGRRRRGRRGGSIKDVFDGMTMKGNQHGTSEKAGADAKASRRDRLKLALRENLKRRKSQVRGRSDAASSESADEFPDSVGGKS